MVKTNPNLAKAWTEEELAIMQEMFATATVAEMMQRLPRHSWPGIRAKGKRLGLERVSIVKKMPFSRADGVCEQCGKPAKLVNSQYVSGLCDPCYRVVYARLKYERRRNHEKKPVFHQFYWMGGTDETLDSPPEQAEATDRSIQEMIHAASQKAAAPMTPEIRELFRTERRILQQLTAFRQQEKRGYVKRRFSGREEI